MAHTSISPAVSPSLNVSGAGTAAIRRRRIPQTSPGPPLQPSCRGSEGRVRLRRVRMTRGGTVSHSAEDNVPLFAAATYSRSFLPLNTVRPAATYPNLEILSEHINCRTVWVLMHVACSSPCSPPSSRHSQLTVPRASATLPTNILPTTTRYSRECTALYDLCLRSCPSGLQFYTTLFLDIEDRPAAGSCDTSSHPEIMPVGSSPGDLLPGNLYPCSVMLLYVCVSFLCCSSRLFAAVEPFKLPQKPLHRLMAVDSWSSNQLFLVPSGLRWPSHVVLCMHTSVVPRDSGISVCLTRCFLRFSTRQERRWLLQTYCSMSMSYFAH